MPMHLERVDTGLFFAMPVDVADSIGLSEGDDVIVRATVAGDMEIVRIREDADIEVVATLNVRRRTEGASPQ